MVLYFYDFVRNAICIEARETICFLIVCFDMTTDKIVIGGCAAFALRQNVVNIPPKFTIAVIISAFSHNPASEIFHFGFLAKGLIPETHSGFSVKVHRFLFALFHNNYGKMLLPPMMKSISQKHVTDHRATYCYEPQRVILIIALQKISRLVFDKIENVQFCKIAELLYHK